MKFIDQAPAYTAKSISLAQAVSKGRARVELASQGAAMGAAFRPTLAAAMAFDTSIDARLKFNDLTTPQKLDLLIDELLPEFYRPDLLPATGRDSWTASFVIDGRFQRHLHMDADGLRATPDPAEPPAFELETDIMTLMAILRSVIADFHTGKLDLAALGPGDMPRQPDRVAQS